MKTEYLLEREIDAVLRLLTPANALVMRAAIHTGLRISDILSIKTDRLASRFWVTERKTGKRRQIGFPEPLLSDLRRQAGKIWVFPGRNPKKHRTRQAVWKDVKRAAAALRLPQNIAPHSARKVFAVELMRKYGDFVRVQKALNHSSPAVTMIYALADMQLAQKKKRRRASTGRKRV